MNDEKKRQMELSLCQLGYPYRLLEMLNEKWPGEDFVQLLISYAENCRSREDRLCSKLMDPRVGFKKELEILRNENETMKRRVCYYESELAKVSDQKVQLEQRAKGQEEYADGLLNRLQTMEEMVRLRSSKHEKEVERLNNQLAASCDESRSLKEQIADLYNENQQLLSEQTTTTAITPTSYFHSPPFTTTTTTMDGDCDGDQFDQPWQRKIYELERALERARNEAKENKIRFDKALKEISRRKSELATFDAWKVETKHELKIKDDALQLALREVAILKDKIDSLSDFHSKPSKKYDAQCQTNLLPPFVGGDGDEVKVEQEVKRNINSSRPREIIEILQQTIKSLQKSESSHHHDATGQSWLQSGSSSSHHHQSPSSSSSSSSSLSFSFGSPRAKVRKLDHHHNHDEPSTSQFDCNNDNNNNDARHHDHHRRHHGRLGQHRHHSSSPKRDTNQNNKSSISTLSSSPLKQLNNNIIQVVRSGVKPSRQVIVNWLDLLQQNQQNQQ